MEYATLILLHVFLAIMWAGGAIAAGFFIIPAVLEAGPAGGAVMGGVVKRRFPIIMTVSGLLVVLSGLRLYSMRFSLDWLRTTHGILLSIGVVAGLAAFAIGVLVQKPAVDRWGSWARSSPRPAHHPPPRTPPRWSGSGRASPRWRVCWPRT